MKNFSFTAWLPNDPKLKTKNLPLRNLVFQKRDRKRNTILVHPNLKTPRHLCYINITTANLDTYYSFLFPRSKYSIRRAPCLSKIQQQWKIGNHLIENFMNKQELEDISMYSVVEVWGEGRPHTRLTSTKRFTNLKVNRTVE